MSDDMYVHTLLLVDRRYSVREKSIRHVWAMNAGINFGSRPQNEDISFKKKTILKTELDRGN